MAKNLFILFLLTLLSSLQIHARDPQLFNKIPSNNGAKETQVAVPRSEETLNNKQEQEPNFVPENENGGYGLYGHESGQLPPSTTTTTNPSGEPYKATTNLPYNNEPRDSYPKYLPKNYNTESYVTEPEGYRPQNSNYNSNNFYNGENTYYNNEKQGLGESTYYNNEQQGLGETKLLGNSYTNPSNNRNNYYNNQNNKNNYGASNSYYNGEQQGLSDTRSNSNNYYSYNGGNANGGAQKQGMSDTRFLENGKYFYDISMEQLLNRGLYGANNRGYYWNDNQNSYNNYQDQEQYQNFQDEDDMPWDIPALCQQRWEWFWLHCMWCFES